MEAEQWQFEVKKLSNFSNSLLRFFLNLLGNPELCRREAQNHGSSTPAIGDPRNQRKTPKTAKS